MKEIIKDVFSKVQFSETAKAIADKGNVGFVTSKSTNFIMQIGEINKGTCFGEFL